jgi:tripartite-type tricarboxylate transporter receptor subunit TctC
MPMGSAISRGASWPSFKTRKLLTLAVTSATRQEALPDVSTVAEFLPGYEASTWYGIGAPKATPTEIIEKLNTEINASLADPKLQAAG